MSSSARETSRLINIRAHVRNVLPSSRRHKTKTDATMKVPTLLVLLLSIPALIHGQEGVNNDTQSSLHVEWRHRERR